MIARVKWSLARVVEAFAYFVQITRYVWFFGALVAGLFLLEDLGRDWVNAVINPPLWIVSNIQLMYISGSVLFYVIFYGFMFRWSDYEAGRLIFAFLASLLGLVILVDVGTFVNAAQPWYEYPTHVEIYFWRPTLRVLIYLSVGIAISAMNLSLMRRYRARTPLEINVPPREPRSPSTNPTKLP